MATSAARTRPGKTGEAAEVEYEVYESAQPFDRRRVRSISRRAFAVLSGADAEGPDTAFDAEFAAELARLWADRPIDRRP